MFWVRHNDGKHDKRYSESMSEMEWKAMQKLLKTMKPEIEMDGEELIIYYYPR